MSKFNKREIEFLDALERIGFSKDLCESINDIRGIVFETTADTNDCDEILEGTLNKRERQRTSGRIANELNAIDWQDFSSLNPEDLVSKISKAFDAVGAWNSKSSKYTTTEDKKTSVRFSDHHPSFKRVAEFIWKNQTGNQVNYERVVCITFFKNRGSEHQTNQLTDGEKYQLNSIPTVEEFTFFLDEMGKTSKNKFGVPKAVADMNDFLRHINEGPIPEEFRKTNDYMTYEKIPADVIKQYACEESR